ncbi:uncharacterized protein MELLADRAFT_74924 [Melampsora larici-populina 98AG31]|uniref:Uncharacterized protein n=1 Tax=Melampsora larici-populina (strain 98AG31 / pathotype 3-4-7) TaxID=747676 RepID=F4RP11_MELLP|nr:uncharacterized protein MELLADRAFT_74924 [Melampsora larici-populina 98AG31]EGG05937.1 hypothetical protein MELLADRAFT_74924 [Melampsora larici-populina 98AG31]
MSTERPYQRKHMPNLEPTDKGRIYHDVGVGCVFANRALSILEGFGSNINIPFQT